MEPSHVGLTDRSAAVTATLLSDQQVYCFLKPKIKMLNISYGVSSGSEVKSAIHH